MVSELSYKTAICAEYERLLCACVRTLEIWKSRREQIAGSGVRSKDCWK